MILNGKKTLEEVKDLLGDNTNYLLLSDALMTASNCDRNSIPRTFVYGAYRRAIRSSESDKRLMRDYFQIIIENIFYNNLTPVEIKKKFDLMLIDTKHNRKKAEEFCKNHNGEYDFKIVANKIIFADNKKLNYEIKSAYIRYVIGQKADALLGFILQGLSGDGTGPFQILHHVTANNIKIIKNEGVNTCSLTSEEKQGGMFTERELIAYAFFVMEFQFSKAQAYAFYQQTGKIITQKEVDDFMAKMAMVLNNLLTSGRKGLNIESFIKIKYPDECIFPKITNNLDLLGDFIGQRKEYPMLMSDLDINFDALRDIVKDKNPSADIFIENSYLLNKQLKKEGKVLPDDFKTKKMY